MLHESIATRLLLPPLIHHDLFPPPLLLLLLLWLDAAQTRGEECCFAGHVVFAVGMLPSPPSPCTVYMLLTQHKMLRSTQAKERKRESDACHDLHFKGSNFNVDAVWMLCGCQESVHYKWRLINIPNVAQIDQQACEKERDGERGCKVLSNLIYVPTTTIKVHAERDTLQSHAQSASLSPSPSPSQQKPDKLVSTTFVAKQRRQDQNQRAKTTKTKAQ